MDGAIFPNHSLPATSPNCFSGKQGWTPEVGIPASHERVSRRLGTRNPKPWSADSASLSPLLSAQAEEPRVTMYAVSSSEFSLWWVKHLLDEALEGRKPEGIFHATWADSNVLGKNRALLWFACAHQCFTVCHLLSAKLWPSRCLKVPFCFEGDESPQSS